MTGQYNLRNPAVKRLMKEAQELREPTEQYFAQPLEDNLFEWHFTIRGPVDSEFEGGIYHGRITLPPEYPMKPPSIMLLTPNGRFETFKKICLSISGHHPESWQPSWSIRTALLAIIGFMPTHGNGAIGSLDYTAEERKVLSKRSMEWKCNECGSMRTMLKAVTEASKKTTEEAKELASQINFQGEKEKNGSSKEGEGPKSPPSAGAESSTAVGPSTITETSGAAGGAGTTPTAPLTPGFPPFNQAMFPPNFPTTMPNVAMPSFMPRMMTPPGTGSPMPPFPRPFWPGMMPTMPGNGSMPARPPGGMMYPWPPMFNPMMMNAQMMAMMNQQMRLPTAAATIPTSAPPVAPPVPLVTPSASPVAPPVPLVTPSASLVTPPASSSSPAQPATSTSTSSAPSSAQVAASVTSTTTTTTTSSSSTGTSSSAPPAQLTSPTSPTTTTQAATTASNTSATSSSSTTPTSSTSAATSGEASAQAPGTTTEAGLRQRTAGTRPPPAPASARPPTYGSAEVPAQTVGRGENPVVVMVMALLGLLIIALILRRLYNVVNAAAFDNDF